VRLRAVLALAPGIVAIVLAFAACAPREEAKAFEPLSLDCSQAFADQAKAITAQPHLVPAPHAPGEPYAFYSTDDNRVSYLITEPGAPGHPAIMMQTAANGDVKTTGCAYGDKRGYEQLRAYLDSLKTWSRR
jgi:hypothetical protein